MVKIKTFVFNPFQENTFLLYDDTKQCAIIDAGCYSEKEKNELVSFIEKNDLEPVKLLNTHCHIDHILGNCFVARQYNLKSEAHQKDNIILENVVQHGRVFGVEAEQPPDMQIFLEENDIVKFGGSQLLVLHVPGHSPGSIVFYNEEQKFAIVGDVLFNGSIGRTDLPGGDYDTLIKNIKEKLFVLEDDVVVYTGHGPETTIGYERKTNPFF